MDEKNNPRQQPGYDFMAAAFEVDDEMGQGFTEDICQESCEKAGRVSRQLRQHATPRMEALCLHREISAHQSELAVSDD
jgi:hypothetical protein